MTPLLAGPSLEGVAAPAPQMPGSFPHSSTQAAPHASALPQLQGPLHHLCSHLKGAFTSSATPPANAAVITSHDISCSNAAHQQHLMQTVIAPPERHQARFFSKFLMGYAGNFISSSCFASCYCLTFWVPCHPIFPRTDRCCWWERAVYQALLVHPHFAPLGPGSHRCPCHWHDKEQHMHHTGMRASASSALLEERPWGWWQEAANLPKGPAAPGHHTRGWSLMGSREGES